MDEMTEPGVFIGIDIGSTSAKTVVLNPSKGLEASFILPTGWSSKDTAETIRRNLLERGFDAGKLPCAATGYGRVAVPYADKRVTEITCHGKGAVEVFGLSDLIVIDIGGQDTKIIDVADGVVTDFIMNDKCSAGTGRFLEVMANTLGTDPAELCALASRGSGITISSMCTVFAESEIISLIGRGEPKENIAFAIVDSIVRKVAGQVGRLDRTREQVCLTGGLCDCPYIIDALSDTLGTPVTTLPLARYAGAIGAALCAMKL